MAERTREKAKAILMLRAAVWALTSGEQGWEPYQPRVPKMKEKVRLLRKFRVCWVDEIFG